MAGLHRRWLKNRGSTSTACGSSLAGSMGRRWGWVALKASTMAFSRRGRWAGTGQVPYTHPQPWVPAGAAWASCPRKRRCHGRHPGCASWAMVFAIRALDAACRSTCPMPPSGRVRQATTLVGSSRTWPCPARLMTSGWGDQAAKSSMTNCRRRNWSGVSGTKLKWYERAFPSTCLAIWARPTILSPYWRHRTATPWSFARRAS